MGDIASWSFSRLMDYESCPLKAYLKHAKRIPDPRPSPAAERGTAIHSLAEDFLRGKIKTLPNELSKFKDEFTSMLKHGDKLMLEQEWGFDSEWKPCEYRSAWGRVKMDCGLELSPQSGIVVDYKTGKKFGNEIKHGEQLQVYALASFIRHPAWNEITAELWYLDVDDLTSITVTRKHAMERYLRVFDRRFRAMTSATEFPAKPNVLSCRWCPYGDTGHCDKRVVDNDATKAFYARRNGGNK